MAAGTNKSVGGTAARRPVPHGVRSSHAHAGGRWKLVYADFVTVLMAFFIVAWIFVFDKISQERRVYDRKCTAAIGRSVEQQFRGEIGEDRSRWPIEVDFSEGVGGVRLTLVDVVEPIFNSGSAVISKFAEPHLDTIAESIMRSEESSDCSGFKIKIEGYTDAQQFKGGDINYGNWELSVDRAGAARRALLSRGIGSQQIEEVVGYGDSRLALPDKPLDGRNRRISITILAPYRLVKGWNDVIDSSVSQ